MPRQPVESELSAEALWLAGRYVEALALDPLIEFVFAEPTLTYAQVVAAAELRRQLGLDDDPAPTPHEKGKP